MTRASWCAGGCGKDAEPGHATCKRPECIDRFARANVAAAHEVEEVPAGPADETAIGVLVVQAGHALTALTFDVSERTKRDVAKNLKRALGPWRARRAS